MVIADVLIKRTESVASRNVRCEREKRSPDVSCLFDRRERQEKSRRWRRVRRTDVTETATLIPADDDDPLATSLD